MPMRHLTINVQPIARILRERGYLTMGQRQFKMLTKAIKGQPIKLTSTGEDRKHIASDLHLQGYFEVKTNTEKGLAKVVPTAIAIKAFREGKIEVNKLPPSGYRKVFRGRPAARRKAA